MKVFIEGIGEMMQRFKEKEGCEPNLLICSPKSFSEIIEAVAKDNFFYLPFPITINSPPPIFLGMRIKIIQELEGRYIRVENGKLERYQDMRVGKVDEEMSDKGLKTLKDMEEFADLGDDYSDIIVVSKELREEAKEWIEDLKKKIDEVFDRKDDNPMNYDYLNLKLGAINWIKHFFNLEEKEVRAENDNDL